MNKGFSDWAKVIAVLGLLVGAASSCGGKTASSGGAGSDTSWLMTCTEDDDCKQGSCLCGVCTISCEDSSDCGKVATDGQCIPTAGLHACEETAEPVSDEICASEKLTTRLRAESRDGDLDAGGGNSNPAGAGSPGAADKLDLLFVVDNSIGMAPSQETLADTLPTFLRRLTSPRCVDASGEETSAPQNPAEPCAASSEREFAPLSDIHVGVITTSLGGYGSPYDCVFDANNANSEQKVDMAHLVGSLPRGGGTDFVKWNGEEPQADFVAAVVGQVRAAGEHGCGWEASLESWYRFLVEPYPHHEITRVNCPLGSDTNQSCIGPTTDATGNALVDSTLLAQRKAFLRPDSALGIVMLSNENDCSFRANGQSWRLAQALQGPSEINTAYRGTAACEENPNDECCQSCGAGAAEGCPTEVNEAGDTVALGCGQSRRFDIPDGERAHPDDSINLRCFEQKRRFGVDYLYPVERYSKALTQKRICPFDDALETDKCSEEQLVDNPLFDDLTYADRLKVDPGAKKAPPRPASRIFLSGILGVPWQDLAQNPSANETLVYRSTANESASKVNWDWIIGERSPADGMARPADPLMQESVDPRTGENPATGEALAGVGAALMANSINGHEWNIAERDDLQYACVTPLKAPMQCSEPDGDPTTVLQPSCNCTDYGDESYQNPLCQTESAYGYTQSYTPAYPSLRQLQVLYEMGERAVPASICAKEVNDESAPDYAYVPALNALLERLEPALSQPE